MRETISPTWARWSESEAEQKEISDAATQLSEDEKRLAIRDEVTIRNKFLASSAKAAGVETPVDYAVFQNRGYQGLYNGLGMKDIHKRKGLKKNEQILDHMGATELAANLFRITQTDDKLRRENIKGKEKANEAHFAVGKKVRQTIAELGGAMPENLPTPKISAKKLKQERKKPLRRNDKQRRPFCQRRQNGFVGKNQKFTYN